MEFLVELTDRAQRDLAAIHDHIHAESSDRPYEWFNGLD
jgi:plasmid stabilization system protein ParE